LVAFNLDIGMSMNIPSQMLRLKGFRYPREVIVYAVSGYYRFVLSRADVEDVLAMRGASVGCEAIRLWTNRFGQGFAGCSRREGPRPNDKWSFMSARVQALR
jgi:putative transposase